MKTAGFSSGRDDPLPGLAGARVHGGVAGLSGHELEKTQSLKESYRTLVGVVEV